MVVQLVTKVASQQREIPARRTVDMPTRDQRTYNPNPQRTLTTKFFFKSCILCIGTFHENNTCPAAGLITDAFTPCGVCEAYFEYTNKTPHDALHALTWNGSVKADSCPYLRQTRQAQKANFLKNVCCCTVCLARTTHKPDECPVRFKIRHYLCT